MDGMTRRRGQRSGGSKSLNARTMTGFLLLVTVAIIIIMLVLQTKTSSSEPSASSISLIINGQSSLSSSMNPRVECKLITPRDNNGGARGRLEITVRNDLSPIASQVFLDLVQSGFYDGCILFRVLKGFVAQWGQHAGGNDNNKSQEKKWTKPPKTRDEIHNATLHNVRGTLSFAGGNPAVQQVFVNLGDNRRLDAENSRPFATLTDSSMLVLDNLFTGYKDGMGQIKTLQRGEQAMLDQFPHMSQIEWCKVVQQFSSS